MTSTKNRKTLDQERAAAAWALVEKVDGTPSDADKATFGREAKKLPTRIITCGLGQALAFVRAKGFDDKKKRLKPPHEALLGALDGFVNRRIGGERQTLLESVVHGDSLLLRRATDEALSFLQWVTRFAEAKGWTGEEDQQG